MEKATRRLLSRFNIEKLYNTRENFTDDVRRYVRNANQGIKDFILLANTLPNSVQKDLFSPKNMKLLLQAVCKGNIRSIHSCIRGVTIIKGQDPQKDTEFNSRRLLIASTFAEESIRVCMEELTNRYDTRINKPLIRILEESIGICNAIGSPYVKVKSSVPPIGYNTLTIHDPKCKCKLCKEAREKLR